MTPRELKSMHAIFNAFDALNELKGKVETNREQYLFDKAMAELSIAKRMYMDGTVRMVIDKAIVASEINHRFDAEYFEKEYGVTK